MDTKTTGVDTAKDEIIEIACILTDFDLKEIDRKAMKVGFDYAKMTPQAQAKNGFTKEAWDKEAKEFRIFVNWLKQKTPFRSVWVPCGHNVGFDIALIKKAFAKSTAFCPFSYRMIDSVGLAGVLKIAKKIGVENLKLDTVASALKCGEPNHTAEKDCEAVVGIVRQVVGMLK